MIFVADTIGRVVQFMKSGVYDTYSDKIGGSFVPPYFMYGHKGEITSRLLAKQSSPDQARAKYPLIALNLDISENTRGDMVDFKLNIVLCTYTDVKFNAEERSNKIIYPTLYSLYKQFQLAFTQSGFFVWDGSLNQTFPPVNKIDRPYWGVNDDKGNNTKNIFGDKLDAIELQNLSFSMEDDQLCGGRLHSSVYDVPFN